MHLLVETIMRSITNVTIVYLNADELEFFFLKMKINNKMECNLLFVLLKSS